MAFLKLVGRSLRPVPGSRRNFVGGALGNRTPGRYGRL